MVRRISGVAEYHRLMKGNEPRDEPGIYRLNIPLRVVSEANAHGHWRERQRRAKAQRASVAFNWALGDLPMRRKPTRVRLVRWGPRKLDSDNLQGAFKHVRDEVAACCGFDDRDESVTWEYAQHTSKSYQITIEVEWS